jgi:glycosyltransferase involved in cell wall biosynthesis
LSQLLRAQGHRVCYVESNCGTETADTLSVTQPDTALGYLRAAAARARLCFTRDFDVLFLQKPLPPNVPSLLIAKLRGKKVALDFDDLDSQWQSTRFRRALTALAERWVPDRVDVVTTHSRYLQQHIEGSSRTPVLLVPQGVDTALFDPRKYDRRAEKQRLGLDGRTVCAFLGSFTRGSAGDLHVILRALQPVMKSRPDLWLLMIGGGGPLESSYRELIRELDLRNVLITGPVAQAEVPRYLAASDIGLVYMGDDRANLMRMSLKLLEYLAMEIRVVGRLAGGSYDIFGKYCFLCEPSIASLSETLSVVVDDGPTRESAREFIRLNYDWQVIGPRLESAVRRITP